MLARLGGRLYTGARNVRAIVAYAHPMFCAPFIGGGNPGAIAHGAFRLAPCSLA